jgi:hypothetical protein
MTSLISIKLNLASDLNKIMDVLHNPNMARKIRKNRIVNRYTPQALKRMARAAYEKNPTIENLDTWKNAVIACKVSK